MIPISPYILKKLGDEDPTSSYHSLGAMSSYGSHGTSVNLHFLI